MYFEYIEIFIFIFWEVEGGPDLTKCWMGTQDWLTKPWNHPPSFQVMIAEWFFSSFDT